MSNGWPRARRFARPRSSRFPASSSSLLPSKGGAKGHVRDTRDGLVGEAVNLERAQRAPSRRYGDVDVVGRQRDSREHRLGDAGDEPLVRACAEEDSLLERRAGRLALACKTQCPAKREEGDRPSDRERVAQQLGGPCGCAQHPGRVAPRKASAGQGDRSLEREAAGHRPFESCRLRRLERGQRFFAAIEHAQRPGPDDGESRILARHSPREVPRAGGGSPPRHPPRTRGASRPTPT